MIDRIFVAFRSEGADAWFKQGAKERFLHGLVDNPADWEKVDDILDVEGASADLGKTAGKDAAAGKPTYPALFGLAESRRLAAECADRARAALAGAELGGQLPAIIDWVTGRSN